MSFAFSIFVEKTVLQPLCTLEEPNRLRKNANTIAKFKAIFLAGVMLNVPFNVEM